MLRATLFPPLFASGAFDLYAFHPRCGRALDTACLLAPFSALTAFASFTCAFSFLAHFVNVVTFSFLLFSRPRV